VYHTDYEQTGELVNVAHARTQSITALSAAVTGCKCSSYTLLSVITASWSAIKLTAAQGAIREISVYQRTR